MNELPVIRQKYALPCDRCKHHHNNGGWCTQWHAVITCDDFEPI